MFLGILRAKLMKKVNGIKLKIQRGKIESF